MSNGVNNSNNNEIFLQELQQKLTNVEETAYQDEGTKQIFFAYNTTQAEGENSIEFLNKEELLALIQDIKKYDGKTGGNPDGKIDINEANLFINDFNAKHPNSKIKSENLFNFIKGMFGRYDARHKEVKPSTNVKPVGDALSQKKIKLNCVIDGQIKTLEVEINLHATDNPKITQLFVFKVVKGEEYKQILAEKYGYEGANAWKEFTAKSVRLGNNTSYDISFQPQFKATSTNEVTNADTTNNNSSHKMSVDGIDSFYVPDDFGGKDPTLIQAQYENEEIKQTMQEFITCFREMLDKSTMTLDEYVKQYGFSAKAADAISKIWNNDFIGGQNSESQIRANIQKYSELLNKMENADNSIEGVLSGKDYGAFFKELTGIEFNPKNVKSYIDARKDYLQKETAISTYKYVHNTVDKAFKDFAKAYKDYKDPPLNSVELLEKNAKEGNLIQLIGQSLMMSPDGMSATNIPLESVNGKYESAKNALFEIFHNILGTSKKNWDAMFKGFEKQGLDPIQCLKDITDTLIASVDKQTEQILGITDLSKIDDYESQLKKNYDGYKHQAIGNSDMLDKVDKYHNSQIIGGAVVFGIVQMGLYAVGVGPVASALSLSSGVASGMAYAGSFLSLEVIDRLTNGVDNETDLFNEEVMLELAAYTGIEFVAGYLFDGILKTKFFGKGENMALKMGKPNLSEAEIIGQAVLENPGKRFTKEKITQLLKVHGFAGIVGGTKDSTKESFKQTLKQKYNLSDVGTAFLTGAIANAFLIKFKKSTFAQQSHKILGKFIDKAPKRGTKSYIKESNNEGLSQEEKEYNILLLEIKAEIINSMAKNLKGVNYTEMEAFMAHHDEDIESIILSYYMSMHCVDYTQ